MSDSPEFSSSMEHSGFVEEDGVFYEDTSMFDLAGEVEVVTDSSSDHHTKPPLPSTYFPEEWNSSGPLHRQIEAPVLNHPPLTEMQRNKPFNIARPLVTPVSRYDEYGETSGPSNASRHNRDLTSENVENIETPARKRQRLAQMQSSQGLSTAFPAPTTLSQYDQSEDNSRSSTSPRYYRDVSRENVAKIESPARSRPPFPQMQSNQRLSGVLPPQTTVSQYDQSGDNSRSSNSPRYNRDFSRKNVSPLVNSGSFKQPIPSTYPDDYLKKSGPLLLFEENNKFNSVRPLQTLRAKPRRPSTYFPVEWNSSGPLHRQIETPVLNHPPLNQTNSTVSRQIPVSQYEQYDEVGESQYRNCLDVLPQNSNFFERTCQNQALCSTERKNAGKLVISTVSYRNLSFDQNLVVIEYYEKHRIIWDHSHPCFKKIDKQKLLRISIEKKCQFLKEAKGEFVKKVWNSLVSKYRSERRRMTPKSGSGIDDIFCDWPFFECLRFLDVNSTNKLPQPAANSTSDTTIRIAPFGMSKAWIRNNSRI